MRVMEKLELSLKKAMSCNGVFTVNENFVIKSEDEVLKTFIYGKEAFEFDLNTKKGVARIFYFQGKISPTFKKYLNYVLEFFNLGEVRVKRGSITAFLKNNVEFVA